MTCQRMVVIGAAILAVVSLQQSLTAHAFLQVDELQSSGFFNKEKSIPKIDCDGLLGVTVVTEDTNCGKPINIGRHNEIGVIDSDTQPDAEGRYEIEPLNFTSYAFFCERTSDAEVLCFTAMTYVLELRNSTENEFQCEMNFTSGDGKESKGRRPLQVVWKKNNETLDGISKTLADSDFQDITEDSGVKAFSVRQTLTIDRNNRTSAGEYACVYVYKTQKLAPENTIEVLATTEVSITFKLQIEEETDESKEAEDESGEEMKEGDDEEKQYSDGDTVQITCQTSGYPRPEIRWLHNGKPLTDVDISVSKTADYVASHFTITNLDDAIHRGNYTCIADNGVDIVVKSRILHARDRLAPLWPFIGIVVQVIVLAVVIAIGEKFRKKKLTKKHRRKQQATRRTGTSDEAE